MGEKPEEGLDAWKKGLEPSEISFVDVKVVDFVGRWRHFTIPAAKFSDFIRGGIGFDGSSYGYSTVEDSDMLVIPDMDTAKMEPNGGGKILSVVGEIFEVAEDGERRPFAACPRRTVRRAVDYLSKSGIANRYLISPEYEFYIFDRAQFSYGKNRAEFKMRSSELMERGDDGKQDDSSHPLTDSEGYHAPRPRDSVMEVRNRIVSFLEEEGISVKYHHHELGGAGESEIEVDFTDMLTGSDNTLYIKHVVREIAQKLGKSATFMPKPINDFPANGMHVHQYLVKNGKNLFEGKHYAGLSQLALYFIGGLLEHGESLMGFTNPTTNSYRRLIPGHEAPVDLSFARSNRSAAIRIPGYLQSEDQQRIELRTIDGSCNPYLGYSAMLMAGLDGIERKIDPLKLGYGPVEDNIYELSEDDRSGFKSAPTSLESALDVLEEDHDYLLKGDVFTGSQLGQWIKLKRQEIRTFQDKPHPYEHVLYYDI